MKDTPGPTRPVPCSLEEQLPNVEIDELMRQQGTKPVDLDEFMKLWPDEFDPDAFDVWLKQYRAENRARPAKDKF
ncbi:MAG TPA: hypothetical protein VK324_13055 [Tepidisphaeraceae bacterium]|nr:hypothetical protein [Tepidisphaeraceae bacterium]